MPKTKDEQDAQQVLLKGILDKTKHFNNIDAQNYKVSTGSLTLDLELDGGINNTIIRCAGFAETGKAQPLDSKVMTPYGWKRIGDLKQGNLIIGSDGKQHQILQTFPQGKKKINKIIFSDHTEVLCCDEHLWLTKDYYDRWKKKNGSVKTTAFIKKTLKFGVHHNHSIPYIKPIEFLRQYRNLPLNPYVLGLLLGDGCFRRKNEVAFSTADYQLVDAISKKLTFLDIKIKKIGKKYDYYIYSKILLNEIKKLGLYNLLSYDKFIPQKYLFSSIENRKAILQGLMDTDGTVAKFKNHSSVEFSTSSIQLAEDVVFLVRSLGGRATIKDRITFFTYKGEKKAGHKSYRIIISFNNFCPFLLQRKKDLYINRTTEFEKFIVDIQDAGEAECICIKVSTKDNLYITDGFNLTHNTSFSLNLAKNFLQGTDRRGVYFLSDKDLSPNLVVRSGVKFVENIEDWVDGTCYIIRTNVYETVCNTIKELIQKGEGKYHTDKQYIFILDSMDNFAPASALESDFGESSQKGGTGAITSHFFKCFNILLPRLGHLTIMISQFRDSINIGRGAPVIKQMNTSGGRSIEHAASWALEFLPAMNSKDDMFWEGSPYTSKKLGHNCIIRLKKTTNEKTGNTVKYPIIYGRENGNSIWVEKEIINLMLFWESIKAKGAWFEFEAGILKEIQNINAEFPKQVQGEDKCTKLLQDNPKVTQFLYEKYRNLLTNNK